MSRKFFRVYDVLKECEDSDLIRIIYNDRLIASGNWYMDNILNMGEKLVAKVDQGSSTSGKFDIWTVVLK